MDTVFRRSAHLLALWAVLALALVPAAGRLFGGMQDGVATLRMHHAPGADDRDPSTDDSLPRAQGECGYCLLAAGMVLPAGVALVGRANTSRDRGIDMRPTSAPRARASSGLGARGPPDAA